MNQASPQGMTKEALEREVSDFHQIFTALENEVHRVIVGNKDVIRSTLVGIFAGGHVLLEGVPGLGKTLLVKSISSALGLSFRRIQFTPDLMPSDITGTQVLSESPDGGRAFTFKPGPIFANIVLADEINRATPKTQSALLEAMEERQVTVLNETYKLDPPFFVLATQNPVELEGTYPLPEAQLDRFLMKILLVPPNPAELKEVLSRTTGSQVPSARTIVPAEKVVATVERMKKLVRHVVVPEPILDALVRMIEALTPRSKFATEKVKRYVRFGSGPRGAQAVLLIAKALAVVDQRINVSFQDVQQAITPALRHRLVLNFQAEADGVTSDDIIAEIRNAR